MRCTSKSHPMRTQILTSALLLFVANANAQFMKIGAKAGANLVKMDGQSFSDGFQSGYYAGGFAEMKLGKNFYLQPEMLFSEANMRTTTSFESLYKDLLKMDTLKSIKLQTLSMPITLNWKIANILSLAVGPQFSINMKKGDGLLKNAGAAFSDGDIAMVAGANIMLGNFRVSGRYAWGMNNMNNISKQETWKQQTAQLGVGFVF